MPENYRTLLGISLDRADELVKEIKESSQHLQPVAKGEDVAFVGFDILTKLVGKIKDPKELALVVFIFGYGAGAMDQWQKVDNLLHNLGFPCQFIDGIMNGFMDTYVHKLDFLVGRGGPETVPTPPAQPKPPESQDMGLKSQDKAPETKGPTVHISDTQKEGNDGNAS